ncbi:MAG: SGNH/GDSL hydrolase family protein [Akkermansiaceae bacterium]
MKVTHIISLSFLATALAQGSHFDDFFFFGDSLTDTGNVAAANGGTLGPGYPGTSVTNGITWAKYLDPDVQLGSVLSATLTPTTGSVDFSFAGATTGDGLLPPNVIAQSQSFAIAAPLLEIDSNDLGFVWAGGNDFLAADLTQPADQLQASLLGIAGQGSTNIATAVDNILGAGVENVAVIKLINIGLAPRLNQLPGAGENFGRIASVFNGQLESKLQGANQNANIMMIDADRFLSDAVANPGAYGFTNSTEAAAPNASVGMASSLTEAELAERLFYDDIHPTTAAHQHFSNYVASHLTLGEDAGSLNLLTDAALALDDRFGFETADLEEGEIRFNAGIYQYENKSGSVGRQTQGLRADLDLGINDHMAVGAEFIYASGDAGDSTLDSFGFAMDSTLGGHLGNGLAWELGGGIGAVTGDLDREHNLGTLDASGKQLAFLLSIHAALRSDEFTFGGFGGYWELGLKERIAFRRDAA